MNSSAVSVRVAIAGCEGEQRQYTRAKTVENPKRTIIVWYLRSNISVPSHETQGKRRTASSLPRYSSGDPPPRRSWIPGSAT